MASRRTASRGVYASARAAIASPSPRGRAQDRQSTLKVPSGQQLALPSPRGGCSRSPSPCPRSASPWSRSRKDKLRLPTASHRAIAVAVEPEEPAPPSVTRTEVQYDVFGKKIFDGPRSVPGDRIQMLKPEHTNRATVFKEDFEKALKSEDVHTLLAIYSMSLDMDARNHNSKLMLVTQHEAEAIKKRLRKLLKQQVDAAMKADNIDALRALFEDIDKDKLFKAISGFPEVHRGRAYLRLRTAHRNLANHDGVDEEVTVKKVKALQASTKQARLIRALTGYVEDSDALLARHRDGTLAPAEKLDAPASPSSTAASSNVGAEEDEAVQEDQEAGEGEDEDDGEEVGEEGGDEEEDEEAAEDEEDVF